MSTVVKDLGAATAYGYAVEKGYTGTEAEFAELMASYATVGQTAVTAAQTATTKASEAATSAIIATNKASEATTAAQTASTKASEAVGCVETATQKATEATQSASQASGYAQTAETAKTDAQTAKTQAETARDNAVTAKTAAETAQGKAEDAQAAAESVAESIPSDYSQLSEDVSDLKEDLNNEVDVIDEYGARNIAPIREGTFYVKTLTVVSKGWSVKISGSSTVGGYLHFNMFNDVNSFPDGISAGDSIQVSHQCKNSNVHFRFYEYINGEESIIADISGTGTEQVKISDDATGCIVRISCVGNATYNDVISNFYIFTSLTKQLIEKAINDSEEKNAKNSAEINTLKAHMPMDYVPLEITPTDGLVSKYNQVTTPAGYAYVKQSVTAGEKYKVSGSYYGGNFPAYLLLNGDSVLSFHNEDVTGAFYGLVVTIPENATHIVVNGNTASPAFLSRYEVIDAGTGGAKSYDSVLVGVGDEYAYNDINKAVVANAGEIISVDYGTYETEIQNLATEKKIIGKDKDLCVLTGTDRNYDTPPIEIAGGIIKHFTINMVNAEDASHKGYCLHSDTSACIGKSLIVEDCTFKCEGQHSVGMGIWQDESVLYKNCEFIFDDDEAEPSHAPFFAHNSGTADGIAYMRFHNCIFRGSGYAIKLSSYSSGGTMCFEFIGCTFESDTLTGDDMIWTDYVAGDTHDQSNLHRFKGKMPLLKTSHGNNVAVANYSE